MKDQLWLVFVAGAVLSWGAYVPVLHEGQTLLSKGSLRAFLCVGIAYFLTAVLVPLALLAAGVEPMQFNARGIVFAVAAGVLGAAGAPCISAFVSMAWHRPKSAPEIWFYVGLVLAAFGAALVLRFKPS